jgi:hypothetical protein
MVRRGVDAVVPIPSFEGRAFVLANPAHAELTAWILVHANDFMAAFGKVAAVESDLRRVRAGMRLARAAAIPRNAGGWG